VLLISPDGTISYAIPSAFDYFGYFSAELIALRVEELMPEPFRGKHTVLRAGYVANPSIRKMAPDLELSAQRKDGTTFPVETGLSPLKSQTGTFVLATVNDLTDYRRASEYQSRLAAMLEGSNYV
jgi:PAS domain S-box-containing protein